MNPAFPNASSDFERLNPGLFPDTNSAPPRAELHGQRPKVARGEVAPVRPQLESSSERGALREGRPKKENPRRFLVRVTSVRGRLLDADNLCVKYVVDCCRYAGLLPGDSPATTEIESRQRKAGKEEAEHTIVEIFALKPIRPEPQPTTT